MTTRGGASNSSPEEGRAETDGGPAMNIEAEGPTLLTEEDWKKLPDITKPAEKIFITMI